MIKIDAAGSVSVMVAGGEYRISSDEDYRNLLVILTDPDPDVDFRDDEFDVDPDVKDPDQIAIASRYGRFFSDFARRRRKKLNDKAAAIARGIVARDAAVAGSGFVSTGADGGKKDGKPSAEVGSNALNED